MKHTIKLSETSKDGNFPCPKCGNLISPDVDDDSVYEVMKTKMKGDGLKALILKCGKCKTRIELVMI